MKLDRFYCFCPNSKFWEDITFHQFMCCTYTSSNAIHVQHLCLISISAGFCKNFSQISIQIVCYVNYTRDHHQRMNCKLTKLTRASLIFIHTVSHEKSNVIFSVWFPLLLKLHLLIWDRFGIGIWLGWGLSLE